MSGIENVRIRWTGLELVVLNTAWFETTTLEPDWKFTAAGFETQPLFVVRWCFCRLQWTHSRDLLNELQRDPVSL